MSRLAARLDAGYSNRTVVRNVDLTLEGGQFVGLLGPNGCGKTTLLKTLAGLLPPRRGDVRLDDTPLDGMTARARARRVALLTSDGLVPHLTRVRALVELGRTPHRGPLEPESDADRLCVSRALDEVGATVLADRFLDELSDGERQKAHLARTLAQETDVLLLDEPERALDLGVRADILATLRRRARQGALVVASLHDAQAARAICDRLIVIKDGRIVADGTPDAALPEDRLAWLYGLDVQIAQLRNGRLDFGPGHPVPGPSGTPLWRSSSGDRLTRDASGLVLAFGGPRAVLSTAPFCGGLRHDLDWAFNYRWPGNCTLRAPSYGEHMRLVAAELGLDPDRSAGLSTVADPAYAGLVEERASDTALMAVATAGIESNAGRVGDPSCWDEAAHQCEQPLQGTINLMLWFDARLTDGALARALITATEAKAAALQELSIGSRASSGLATGTGTDGAILIARDDSPMILTEAGKHCLLGELIGRTVKRAVKAALAAQLTAFPRRDGVTLLARFGVTEQALLARAATLEPHISADDLATRLGEWRTSSDGVTRALLWAQALDQRAWDMLTGNELAQSARLIWGDNSSVDTIELVARRLLEVRP